LEYRKKGTKNPAEICSTPHLARERKKGKGFERKTGKRKTGMGLERKIGIRIGEKKGKGIRKKSRKWNWRDGGRERNLGRRTGKEDWREGREQGLEQRTGMWIREKKKKERVYRKGRTRGLERRKRKGLHCKC
jgi:hypothetical protein